MRIEQLIQILEVEKTESVSKAAEALFITQPVLSRSIHALEKELRLEIFHRTSAGMVPTESGKKVLEQARVVLREIHKLYGEGQDATMLQGKIRFSLVPSLYNGMYSDLMLLCQEKYERMEPEIEKCNYLQAMEKIIDDKCDVVVAYIPASPDKAGERIIRRVQRNEQLVCEVLKSIPILACVSVDSPLAGQKEVTMHDLLAGRIIIQQKESLAALGLSETDCSYVVVSDDWQMLKMVIENKGYVITPNFSFGHTISAIENSICLIPIADKHLFTDVCLIYKNAFHGTSLIEELRTLTLKNICIYN